MNETNYASILIKRTIAIIIYLLFGSTFTISIMTMILNTKFNLQRLIIFSAIITFLVIQIIKSVKEIINVIKEIKIRKKINIYLRNIGQVFMGLSFITLISSLLFRLLDATNNVIIKIFLFGMVISIVLITIDKILVILEINNRVLEIDKSDE